MPLTSDQAAAQVQDRLKSLQEIVHEIDGERKRSESTILNIHRTQV